MPFYRKKQIIIEAKEFSLSVAANKRDWFALTRWCNGKPTYMIPDAAENRGILIETLEGAMEAEVGDWIIRGVKGEFYPIKPDIFKETYEWRHD